MIMPETPRAEVFRTFKDLWKITALSDGIVFTESPNAVTAVCYFPPLYLKDRGILDEELEGFVRSLFSLPVDSIVSSYLVKQFKDYDVQGYQGSKHPIMQVLEDKRMEGINQFISPAYHTYFSITVPIQFSQGRKSSFLEILKGGPKRTQLDDPDYQRESRQAVEILLNTIEQIRARFGGACRKLSTEELIRFLGMLLNHSTEDPLSLPGLLESDALSNSAKGVTYYGGNFHTCLSLRHDGFPQNADPDFMGLFFAEQLRPVPFIVKATLRLPEPTEAKRKANAMVSRIDVYSGLFQKLVKDLMVQKSKLDQALLNIEETGGRFLDFSFAVMTWAPDEIALNNNAKAILNMLRGKEMVLRADTYNHKATFHSFPPFASHLNPIHTRLISPNAEPFLPLLYPPFYRNDPKRKMEVPTYFHNTHDVLMDLDVMDERDPQWNGIICGGSGSGKSFLTNYIIYNHLKANGKVFIIDKGGPGQGSFRNLVMNVPSGKYIEIKFQGDQGFTINFFDGPLFVREERNGSLSADMNGEVDANKENFLIQVLAVMKADRPGETLRKTEKAVLSTLIRTAYRETDNNAGNVLNLNTFAQKYLKESNPELYQQMRQYIGDGIYSRFFDSTTALEDVDIFCFDLEGLSEHPDLETVLTLVITRLTYDMCIRNRGIRKMIVIDEAWAQLSGGGLSATVEGIWRTIRKHGGFIYCISQSYGDIVNSKIGDALTTSTSHYYFCGASHSFDVIRKLKATGSNTHMISEYDFECIQALKFNPPHYADYFLMTPNYKGSLRLRPSPYDYWFSTTNARDKAKLDQVKQRLGVPYVNKDVLEEVTRGTT